MKRIDFHTHILPGVDDGAKDMEMATQMLRRMEWSHVDTIVATPHYFSLDESPESFRKRVEDAHRTLKEHSSVKLLLGAEVYLERNLLLMEHLEQLCITGTDLLLLELPVSEYRAWMHTQIVNLASVFGIRPVIAHVERILSRISKADLDKLLEVPGICFQFNHSAFASRKAMAFLKKLIKRGYPVFFGSDCHDTDVRCPTDEAGYVKVETWLSKKAGRDLPDQIAWMQQCELKIV